MMALTKVAPLVQSKAVPMVGPMGRSWAEQMVGKTEAQMVANWGTHLAD